MHISSIGSSPNVTGNIVIPKYAGFEFSRSNTFSTNYILKFIIQQSIEEIESLNINTNFSLTKFQLS